MKTLDRRTFVIAATVAAGAAAAGDATGQPLNALHCILVENGTLGPDRFSVGMLMLHDIDDHAHRLSSLREATGFRPPLRYTSTNRFKIPFVTRLIGHVAGAADIKIALVHVTPLDADTRRRAKRRREVRDKAYARLFDKLPETWRRTVVVHLWRSGKGAYDPALKARLQKQLGPDATIAFDTPKTQELSDFASVLFGTINHAQAKGRSSTKIKIAEVLAEAIHQPDLTVASLNKADRFVVEVVKA